jgi:hypothetical protein
MKKEVLFSRCSETEDEYILFFLIVKEIGSLKMEVIDFAT